MEEGEEGCKRNGESGTEGGSQESGNYTLSRGGSGREACKDKSDTEMDRVEEGWAHLNETQGTRRGTLLIPT